MENNRESVELMKKHALIVGPRRVGKSTLIRKVIKALNCPVSGFETKKEAEMKDETLGSPIYIHSIGEPWHYSEENLLGYCKNQKTQRISDAFNRYADKLLQPVSEETILCFDEIGFMESKEKTFCDAVLECLDGDIPILAAVKDKEVPFLNQVRNHPNCKCFFITEKNRDELADEVLEFMKSQIEK